MAMAEAEATQRNLHTHQWFGGLHSSLPLPCPPSMQGSSRCMPCNRSHPVLKVVVVVMAMAVMAVVATHDLWCNLHTRKWMGWSHSSLPLSCLQSMRGSSRCMPRNITGASLTPPRRTAPARRSPSLLVGVWACRRASTRLLQRSCRQCFGQSVTNENLEGFSILPDFARDSESSRLGITCSQTRSSSSSRLV